MSLHLNKQNAIKTYGWMEVQLHTFLTSVVDGHKWQIHVLAVILLEK
jgi:hypothetical protein